MGLQQNFYAQEPKKIREKISCPIDKQFWIWAVLSLFALPSTAIEKRKYLKASIFPYEHFSF